MENIGILLGVEVILCKQLYDLRVYRAVAVNKLNQQESLQHICEINGWNRKIMAMKEAIIRKRKQAVQYLKNTKNFNNQKVYEFNTTANKFIHHKLQMSGRNQRF